MRVKATTTSYDGSTETSRYIPTATELVRANEETVTVTPGTNYNIYTGLGFTLATHKINRRYTIMYSAAITETKAGGGTEDHVVTLNYRPDGRNQISRTFTFTSSDSETVTGTVMANVNFDAGTTTVQITFDEGDSTSTFVADSATFKLRFRPVGSNNGRTKVSVTTEMIDCTIDPNEDFLLELEEEDIQDELILV